MVSGIMMNFHGGNYLNQKFNRLKSQFSFHPKFPEASIELGSCPNTCNRVKVKQNSDDSENPLLLSLGKPKYV